MISGGNLTRGKSSVFCKAGLDCENDATVEKDDSETDAPQPNSRSQQSGQNTTVSAGSSSRGSSPISAFQPAASRGASRPHSAQRISVMRLGLGPAPRA